MSIGMSWWVAVPMKLPKHVIVSVGVGGMWDVLAHELECVCVYLAILCVSL